MENFAYFEVGALFRRRILKSFERLNPEACTGAILKWAGEILLKNNKRLFANQRNRPCPGYWHLFDYHVVCGSRTEELSYDRYNKKAKRIISVILKGKVNGEVIKEAVTPTPRHFKVNLPR